MRKSIALFLCAAVLHGCSRQYVAKPVGYAPSFTNRSDFTVALDDSAYLQTEFPKKENTIGRGVNVTVYGGFGPEVFEEVKAIYERRFQKVVVARSPEAAALAGADIFVKTDFIFRKKAFTKTLFYVDAIQLSGSFVDPKTGTSIISFDYVDDRISQTGGQRAVTLFATLFSGMLLFKPFADVEAKRYIRLYDEARKRLLSKLDKEMLARPAFDRWPEYRNRFLAKQAPQRVERSQTAPPAITRSEPAVAGPVYRERERPNDFAVVVGVQDYQSLPSADFAERDAEAFAEHARALGVPERNLVRLTGDRATRSALAKYLESWLPKNVKPGGRVYFYFSGHGAPDPSSGEAYLMPWNADASFLKDTAYPLERLYAKLADLKGQEVVVALDACFSGAGGRSVLAEGARPLVTTVDTTAKAPAALTLLTAASGSEITATLKEKGHGTFTYYLLDGLNGSAADGRGSVTTQGLFRYLSPKVQDAARRQNREQHPVLRSKTDLLLR